MSRASVETFPNAAAAAAAAAEAIAGQLRGPSGKSLIVTGGRGPGPVYDRLAASDLDWASVIVTLSDDRFVPLGAPESNEAMVRARLLQHRAAAARLVPLNGAEQTPDAAAEAVEPEIAALAPFDAALLGMGPDGHIASLYASNSDAAQWLDPDCARWVVGVQSAGWTPYVLARHPHRPGAVRRPAHRAAGRRRGQTGGDRADRSRSGVQPAGRRVAAADAQPRPGALVARRRIIRGV